MRFLLLIDHLNSGGAQRQLVNLAVLLAELGHQVDFVRYYPHDFFAEQLNHRNIRLHLVSANNPVIRIKQIRNRIRSAKPDVVIAFLNTPAILAELATLPRKNFCLVVSERNLTLDQPDLRERLRLRLHRFADFVVSNSIAQAEYLSRTAPYLQPKIRVIHNCVDLNEFFPGSPDSDPVGQNNLLVVGRFNHQKNPFGLLAAVELLQLQEPGLNVSVDWYGSNFYVDGTPTARSKTFETLAAEIKKKNLEDRFRLRAPQRDMRCLYLQAPVVCLPSLFEGFSNVLCEAAACGRPMLASDVSDNGVIVKQGLNGLLFDPTDPQKIAAAIKQFFNLSPAERAAMGKASREFAEENLSPARYVRQYLELVGQRT